MPAGYTHYVYGDLVFNALDQSIQDKIRPYRAYYDIGIHGPDILFFHKVYLINNKVLKKGYAMHYELARDFFENTREKIRNSSNPDAALAYVLGFINHFVLDSECHGLINQKVRDLPISHSELESEFDARIMREQGLNHVTTKTMEHIHIDEIDPQILAEIFEVSKKEIEISINSMVFLLNVFVAPSKLKRSALYAGMKCVGVYKKYHGLIFNYEENKSCVDIISTLQDKMMFAVNDSIELIHEYIELCYSAQPLSKRYDHDYEGS